MDIPDDTTGAGQKSRIDVELKLYQDMLRARSMEEAISSLFDKNLASGTTHLGIGQEAVSVGVVSNLKQEDYVVGTYRGHVAALAKGISMYEIISEVLGRSSGCNGGFGGSMHLTKESVGLVGDFSIVGAGIPVATGLGLASLLKRDRRVAVCFFGDGAINNGYFHESMNLAALYGVRTLFAVENNLYGEHSAISETTRVKDILELTRPYGIESISCDGNDVDLVRAVSAMALAEIRKDDDPQTGARGKKPIFIEFKTFRSVGHSKLDKQSEGSEAEREAWLSKDPIMSFRSKLLGKGILDDSRDRRIREAVEAEVKDSVDRALASPYPSPETMTAKVFADAIPSNDQGEANSEGEVISMSMRSAIRSALMESMEGDPSIIVFGEDVAQWGGVFKVTEGLRERFGKDRVWDTPISESSIVGMALGLALAGLRPVVEIMFSDFLLMAMDALGNEVAKKRWISGGHSDVPLVVRTACGLQSGWGATHSQSLDTLLLTTPGIRILTPSNAYDAKGLLCEALRGRDPVVFFEHKGLYSTTAAVPSEFYTIPLGRARVARNGKDVTVVANMERVNTALGAAQILERRDISAEVIDLRCLAPLDLETVLSSVRKTGILVTIEETNIAAGWGNLVAASVAERELYSLRAPVKRLAGPNAPIPYSPALEKGFTLDAQEIAVAISGLLETNA